MTPRARTVGVKFSLTPNGLNSMVTVGMPKAPTVASDRYWELPAGMKPRGIAGKCDQVRLGEPADQSLFLKRVDGDIDKVAIGIVENVGDDAAERRCDLSRRARQKS